jgi:hypothetical protein
MRKEESEEVRHERLVIGQTTLPKGHSIGNRTSALHTETFDRSPLLGRAAAFMKFAKEKNKDKEELKNKDPVVILEKNEEEDKKKKNEKEEVELDIVLVKDPKTSSDDVERERLSSKQETDTKAIATKKPLIVTIE